MNKTSVILAVAAVLTAFLSGCGAGPGSSPDRPQYVKCIDN